MCSSDLFFFSFFKIIYLLFILAVPGLSCSTWESSLRHAGSSGCGMHVGSSSPTRERTWAPCIVSSESYPLDHQGSPEKQAFKYFLDPGTQDPFPINNLFRSIEKQVESDLSLVLYQRGWHSSQVVRPLTLILSMVHFLG